MHHLLNVPTVNMNRSQLRNSLSFFKKIHFIWNTCSSVLFCTPVRLGLQQIYEMRNVLNGFS